MSTSATYGYTGTIENATITESGIYDITADGAQGGTGNFGAVAGGLGAAVGGDVFLAAGTELKIVVGGKGFDGNFGGGGGGGSFVIETFNGTSTVDTLLEAAGGGGGGGSSGHGANGVASTHAGAGGAGSVGGGGGGVGDHPGDGGGFEGGGGGGYTGGGGGSSTTSGSMAGTTFDGGESNSGGGAHGGWGGGGAGTNGGGGGGGYGGGGGGGGGLGGGGGGGGSFLKGDFTNVTETAGAHGGNGQVVITFESVCFASGTRVRTVGGDVAVEELKVGDLALTTSGEARPIRWIGHRKVARPAPEQQPVRVMSGAFGEGLPARDLLLSPGHAVCVTAMDEVFVPVGQLVNGATIDRVEVGEVTYWHVELESHDVLLAEGLPCESYMDAGNREWFGREHGRLAEIDPERVAESLARYARPLVDAGPIVEAIRERLAARAVALGWTCTDDMDLHLIVGGERIEAVIDGDRARFLFPATASEARLVSRTFVPGGDHRSLGVRIEALRVSDGLRLSREVPLGALSEGVHGIEHDGRRPWRWTNGEAVLPAKLWESCDGFAILTVAFRAGRRWLGRYPLRAAA